VADVVLPKMGMQTVEVDVVKVCVQVGDRVAAGDPLFEVESEKVTMAVEAEGAGVVTELFAAEGDVVAPGDLLARISQS
jgi:pyruvate/2-oxoglutarate dehydrogenase complex dihydrolipoamide acyltransferase (E2) component